VRDGQVGLVNREASRPSCGPACQVVPA